MAVITTTAGSDTSSLGDISPVPIVREDLLFVGSGVPASGNDTLASTDSVPTVTVGQDVKLSFIPDRGLEIVGQDVLFVAPEKSPYVPATLDDTLSAASVADLPAPTLAAEGMVLLDESMLLESALLQPSANYVPSSNNVQPSSNDPQSILFNALTAGKSLSPSEAAQYNDLIANTLGKTSASLQQIIDNMR